MQILFCSFPNNNEVITTNLANDMAACLLWHVQIFIVSEGQ